MMPFAPPLPPFAPRKGALSHGHQQRSVMCPAALIICCLLLSGCGTPEIHTEYGERAGAEAEDSVNGTAVFAQMFEQAGHKVASWRTLSPRLKASADVIVWFPDDFKPPSSQTIQWFEAWLRERPDRLLIYVGRDFDAAPGYWTKIRPNAPADQQATIDANLKQANEDYLLDRQVPGANAANCDWFATKDLPVRKPKTLAGPWSKGIDATKIEIEMRRELKPHEAQKPPLLAAGDGEPIISLEEFAVGYYGDQSEVIYVVNGSFLLNLPLVNKEHRKLAQRLIDVVPKSGSQVVMLESEEGGPRIAKTDEPPRLQGGLDVLGIHPLSWVLVHLSIVGLIFCFARYPIFGVPRDPLAANTADFGKHIDAFGEQLQRTKDAKYAWGRLKHYQQLVASDKPALRGLGRRKA